MDELEKNVKQVVVSKVLKDIHKIVNEDKVKEAREKRWAMIILSLILAVVVLLVLNSV